MLRACARRVLRPDQRRHCDYGAERECDGSASASVQERTKSRMLRSFRHIRSPAMRVADCNMALRGDSPLSGGLIRGNLAGADSMTPDQAAGVAGPNGFAIIQSNNALEQTK